MKKSSIILAFTGDGKGKTSAAIGLACRALGAEKKVAFVQFVKSWEVSEHRFFAKIAEIYADNFFFYKGGKGFFHAGKDSATEKIIDKNGKKISQKISDNDHKKAARKTFEIALNLINKSEKNSQKTDLLICDEINNAVSDGLLSEGNLRKLIVSARKNSVNLCLTGRNFPENLLAEIDIATDMKKIKHHYDDGFLAEKGIDF